MTECPQPDAITAVVHDVRESEARFPVLTALLRARRLGLDLDAPLLGTVAESFGRPPARVEAVARWVEALASPPDGCDTLHLCAGVGCSTRGAALLHRQVLSELDAIGCTLVPQTVHCLDHCDSGPSLAIGDRVYVGSSEDVAVDERPWRQAPFQA